jgi:hypothetical protein
MRFFGPFYGRIGISRLRKREPVVPMTICIAAVCNDQGRYNLIFCSDRLVTDDDGLTFEQGHPKIDYVLDNCFVMSAGLSYEADKLIEAVSTLIKENKKKDALKLKDIAELFSSEHKKLRDKSLEADVLGPRGMTLTSFYSGLKAFPSWFAFGVDSQIRDYTLSVEFLLFGFDIEKSKENVSVTPHIFLIDDQGQISPLDSDGFGIIGIGERISLPEMTRETYDKNTPLSEALFRVFWAKKSAERVVSVGTKTTDLGLMWTDTNEKGDITVKNTLIPDDFKEKILSAGVRQMDESLKQVSGEIKKNIDDILHGKKAITEKAG